MYCIRGSLKKWISLVGSLILRGYTAPNLFRTPNSTEASLARKVSSRLKLPRTQATATENPTCCSNTRLGRWNASNPIVSLYVKMWVPGD